MGVKYYRWKRRRKNNRYFFRILRKKLSTRQTISIKLRRIHARIVRIIRNTIIWNSLMIKIT